jgi:glycosyltransferase involved in cell wall biosynthesis
MNQTSQSKKLSQSSNAILIGQLNLGGAERQAKLVFEEMSRISETYLIIKNSKIRSNTGGLFKEIKKSYLAGVIKLDEMQLVNYRKNTQPRAEVRKYFRPLRILIKKQRKYFRPLRILIKKQRKYFRPLRILIKKQRKLFKNIIIVLKLRNTLKNQNTKTVFAFLPSSLVLISAVKFTSYRLFKDLKIIMCVRSSTNHIDGTKLIPYKLIVKVFPDFYITNSNFLREELMNQYKISSNKIQIVRNKIDSKILHLLDNPPSGKKESKIKIITVGNVKKVKNNEKILRIMEVLEDEGHRFHYSHIGETRFIQTEKYKNSSQIHFLGPQTHLQTLKAIYESDIFINFSESEGSSNAVLEALCLGTICVLSDIPSNRELAGSFGVFCSSEIDIVLAIKKLIKYDMNLKAEVKKRNRSARSSKYIQTYNNDLKSEGSYDKLAEIFNPTQRH